MDERPDRLFVGAQFVKVFPTRAGLRMIDRALLGLALLFGAALIIANSVCSVPRLNISDQFDPDLQSIRSVDSAVAYVKGTRTNASDAATATAIDGFVRKRFVHGYSQLKPCQDWLAYLAGYVWKDLRSPVLPDDILQFRRGACSQQSIVFEAVARKFGLDVASVRLTGHFLPAARIDGRWIVYDTDREIDPHSYRLDSLRAGDPAVIALYGEFGRQSDMAGQAQRGQIRVSEINSNPAPRASVFHRLTHLFSHFGWAIFLGLFLARNAARAFILDRQQARLPQPMPAE
jgi:hypothetical protein